MLYFVFKYRNKKRNEILGHCFTEAVVCTRLQERKEKDISLRYSSQAS